MGTEVVVKDKKSAWYIYVLIGLIIIGIGVGVYYLYKEINAKKLKTELIRDNTEILDSLTSAYNTLKDSLNVPLADLEKLKIELDSLEKKLNEVKDQDMTLEEALEILK